MSMLKAIIEAKAELAKREEAWFRDPPPFLHFVTPNGFAIIRDECKRQGVEWPYNMVLYEPWTLADVPA